MQMIPIQGLFFKGKESLNSIYLIFIAAMQMFPIQGLYLKRERKPEFHLFNCRYANGPH